MNGNEIIKKETMTSLEIAEVTGRNHKDVMRSIREMEDAWVKVNGASLRWLSIMMQKAK